jgi:hypothetical protein
MHIVELNGEIYFVENKTKLGLDYIGTIQTIGSMGCTVKTGSVAWNQYKE